MDTLVADFTDSLRSGAPKRDALATVGEPDPSAAVESFAKAAEHPDLAPALALWCPVLLTSARPRHAAQRLWELAGERRAIGKPLDLRQTPALPIVLGASDFLSRLLVHRPEWVDELQCNEPETAVPSAPSRDLPAPNWEAIRDAKYRGLLRVAARDLLERPFTHSLRELSDLADGCLSAAMRCTALETEAIAPALFTLGKLGGRELNFSSDVDLMFIYDSSGGDFDASRSQAATTFIRHFKKGLEQPSPEGFIYRVDLGLRPEGAAGPLALSIAATLDYYQTLGADWERQMLIRLRPLTGPPAITTGFSEELRPFVYRDPIAPSAFHDVRAMKQRIEAERRAAGRDLEVDLKEGPGGIRDVEFLVQSFQLFWGGRKPSLRTGNTLDGLAELAEAGLLPNTTAQQLSTSYMWLRRAEHALQLAEEQQTATFPRGDAARLCLARRMGYADVSGAAARSRLLSDWTEVRQRVRAYFEDLVVQEKP